MTRAEAKQAFNHVLVKVLDTCNLSSLKRSPIEDGITDVFDLINLTNDVIDRLAYEDPNDKIFDPIKKGDKMFLRCFLAYQQSLETTTGNVDYKPITQSNFDCYCISPAYRAALYQPDPALSSASPSSTPPLAMTSSHPSHYSPVAMFRHAIKKDPSLFPVLKDDKYHDVWHHSFNTQDVADVLDEMYAPTTVDDIALFSEKQNFVYAVLESKFQTNRGKAVICDHEHEFDAQKV
jgi:hypothetical protein